MPAIGPAPRPECFSEPDTDVVAVFDPEEDGPAVADSKTPVAVVVLVGKASTGKTFSPGLNSSVAFWENRNWFSKVSVEFYGGVRRRSFM